MSNNIIVDILQKQEAERRANKTEWGIKNRARLVQVIEDNGGGAVSDYMWDMLLFNINGLRVNANGKLCYLTFHPESKRIMKLLNQNAGAIKANFDYITKG